MSANVGDQTGSRAVLVTAFAVGVISVLGLAALGTLPPADATGADVVAWFREHGDRVRWSVWAGTLQLPLLTLLVALLRRLLPPVYHDVFLIGGIAVASAAAVQGWFLGGLALHADRLDPSVARTTLDVAIFFGPVLTGATTTLMMPITGLALTGRAGLPRWLGILGAIVIAEQLIETITIFGSSGFTEPGGAMNMQLGAALFVAWLAALSVWAGTRGRFAA
jgi:hypothetical protein